jgi:hypothetical protein
MKQLVKMKQTLTAILVIVSLCLHNNASYGQGILGKIKKTTDDAKKAKNDAKEQANEVKNQTGVSENRDTSNTINQDNNQHIAIPATNQAFVNKITVSNLTGQTVLLSIRIYDKGIDLRGVQGIKPIVCEGRACVVDLESRVIKEYFASENGAVIKKTVKDGGRFVYAIQANSDDGDEKGKLDPSQTILFSKEYNGDDLKKSGYVVKVEIAPQARVELEKKAKLQQANKDANDPTKLGVLTIVNAVGGKGKIYCVLRVPNKSTGGGYKKVEFMLGENKGDKYVIKDLRLFIGYDLRTMPESEKGKDPQTQGITYISNSLSGLAGADTFQMQDGLTANVGSGSR